MDQTRDYYTKWIRQRKTNNHMTSLLCGILKMIQMNIFTKQKQTHGHREQMGCYQGWEAQGCHASLLGNWILVPPVIDRDSQHYTDEDGGVYRI